jgi:anti-anti-sigma factor
MTDEVAARPLTLEIERHGKTAVVRCSGRLVAGTGELLYTQVRQLMPESDRIVLDLKDLVRVDSLGLGTLVRLYVSARSEKCELELMHLGKQVRQVLGMTNLLSVFTVVGEHGIRIG